MGLWAVASLLALVVTSGCGGGGAAAPSSSGTASATASPESKILRVVTFPLNAQYGFKPHGSVRIDVREVGYTLTASITEMQSDKTYLFNIHAGTCAFEETSFLLDVGRLSSDAAGRVTYTHSFSEGYLIPPAGRILTLHGPLTTDDARSHIACADMTN
jgi:hypothetical protein